MSSHRPSHLPLRERLRVAADLAAARRGVPVPAFALPEAWLRELVGRLHERGLTAAAASLSGPAGADSPRPTVPVAEAVGAVEALEAWLLVLDPLLTPARVLDALWTLRDALLESARGAS